MMSSFFSSRSRPRFLIIGAQKAGTTALFHMLNRHPLLFGPPIKEIHYFDNDAWYQEGRIGDYHRQFPKKGDLKKGSLCFEATPMYLFHPEVPERIHRYAPDIKLIVILREPAERAFSAWTMYHHHFREGKYSYLHDPRGFDVAVEEEMHRFTSWAFEKDKVAYVRRGIYVEQLTRYFRFFDSSQILILNHRDLLEDFEVVSKLIQDFIGVEYAFIEFEERNRREVDEAGKYESTFAELRTFYRSHNDALNELLGRDMGW